MEFKQIYRIVKIYLLLYILAFLPIAFSYLPYFSSIEPIYITSINIQTPLYIIIIISVLINLFYISKYSDPTSHFNSIFGISLTFFIEIIAILFLFVDADLSISYHPRYLPTLFSLIIGVIITFTIPCFIGEDKYSKERYIREKYREKLGGF